MPDSIDPAEAPSPAPELTQKEALLLFRLRFSDDARAEGMALAEPWRGMAVRLPNARVEIRKYLMEEMTAALPPDKRAELERAQGKIGRPPLPLPVATPEPKTTPATSAARAIPSPRPALPPHELAVVDAWPDPLGPAALSGVAGDLVRAIEPTTEADPAAVLIQFLVAFGNLVGRGPHVWVDGHRHAANLFAVVVGDTSRARKGTSWRRVRQALEASDPTWTSERIMGGLSSGEGLIWAVRDSIVGVDRRTGVEEVSDPGVSDKRLLVVESEFGGALRVLNREGNTLSAILRLGYDGEDLRSMTKNSPAAATGPHISLCGHITRHELERNLSAVEMFNGLGNRILWACARRSKVLPFGGEPDPKTMEALSSFLAGLAEDARYAGALSWASSGAHRWAQFYDDLTAPQADALGALTSRAEAHTLRLAIIYALLDRSKEIADVHVEAALAVWRYCADSAALLFGRPTVDADREAVLAVLRFRAGGLTRTEIRREAFKNNRSAEALNRILDDLVQSGAVGVTEEEQRNGGRPAVRYFAA